MTDNVKRFTDAYTDALRHYVAKNPADYGYGPEGVPAVVAKMVPAYAAGRANIGPAMKRAARALGIKPTLGAVRAYLTDAGPSPTDEARAFLRDHFACVVVR